MRKSIVALFVLLLSAISVNAQAPIFWTTYNFPAGSAMPSGYTFTNPNLYAATSASLQSLGTPFGFAFWMNIAGIPFAGKTYLVNSNGTPFGAGPTKGLSHIWDSGQAPSFSYFTGVYPAINSGGYAGLGCSRHGTTCTRDILVDDGNWHHMCYTWDATHGMTSYIDGVFADQNTQITAGFTPSTDYWTIGPVASGTVGGVPISYRDIRFYNSGVLNQNYCALLYQMGVQQNQVPAAGPLSTGMVAHWTLDSATCTPSGADTICTDSSGNSNNLSTDTVPPTVAVTTPTAGSYSGNISFTGTCSDPIVCKNARWTVDGEDVSGPITASPYTFSWNSANFVDGSHVVAINGYNASNTVGTASVTITTSNSVTAKNYYFDSSGGSDSNNCLSTVTACQTIQKATCSFVYHGGDTINFKAGSVFTLNAAPSCVTGGGSGFVLDAPSSSALLSAVNFYPSGAPLVVSTYGGGTCNVFGTTTGCATINLNPASTITTPFVLNAVGNTTVSNLVVIGGTAATLPLSGGNGIGIYVRHQTTGNRSGITVSNNKVLDFYSDITSTDFTGSILQCSIQNNYLGGSVPSASVSTGVFVQSANNQCNVIGNYVVNVGCPAAGECIQGAILTANGAGPVIDEFNVTTAAHYNTRTCGSADANWTFDTIGVIVQFNESYNNFPHVWTPGMCDAGDFNIDGSNRNNIFQYNYAHDTWGGALAAFTGNQAGPTWSNNTFRYNIIEHTMYNGFDGTGSIAGFGGGNFTNVNFYNNTIWDNVNGTIDPVSGNTVNRGVFGFTSCPGTASYIANNIFAAQAGADGQARFYASFAALNCSSTAIYRNNDWYAISGTPFWFRANGLTSYTSYAAWSAYSGETGGQTANPQLVSPGTHPTCYVAGTTPSGPAPCDAGMKLQATSPMLGAGINLNSAFGLNVGNSDYYGNVCPGSMGGSGFNIGADACGNP